MFGVLIICRTPKAEPSVVPSITLVVEADFNKNPVPPAIVRFSAVVEALRIMIVRRSPTPRELHIGVVEAGSVNVSPAALLMV